MCSITNYYGVVILNQTNNLINKVNKRLFVVQQLCLNCRQLSTVQNDEFGPLGPKPIETIYILTELSLFNGLDLIDDKKK